MDKVWFSGFKYHVNLVCHAQHIFTHLISTQSSVRVSIVTQDFSATNFKIFKRKNRREVFGVSSENILHLTFCGLLSVALHQHQAITNITKHSIQQRIFRRKIRKQPLKQTAVSKRIFKNQQYILNQIFLLLYVKQYLYQFLCSQTKILQK